MGVNRHHRCDQKDQANVGRNQVIESGKTHLLVGVVPYHHQPSSQCRQLPSKQKDQGMLACVDQYKRNGGHVEQGEVHAQVPRSLEERTQIADGVQAANERHGQ